MSIGKVKMMNLFMKPIEDYSRNLTYRTMPVLASTMR